MRRTRWPRTVTAAVVALIVLAVVAGCAGTAPSASGPQAPSAQGPDPSGAAAAVELTFTADQDSAAAGTVTFEDGGTVSTTARDGTTFDLEVPPHAVPVDTEIRLTPLSDVEGLEAGAMHAVHLEPEGIEFAEFVRLTITPAEAIDVENQLSFEAAGDGTAVLPAIVDPTSEPIVLLLEHFSVGGVASVSVEQRATFMRKSADNAERRITAQVRDLLQAERVRQLLGGSEDAGAATMEEVNRLLEEYKREVVDKRIEAATTSCTHLLEAIRTAISFERQSQLLGAGEDPEAFSQMVSSFMARVAECEQEARQRCKAERNAAILIEFWLATFPALAAAPAGGAQPDIPQPTPQMVERAKEICEPQGFRLEFRGEDLPLRTAQIGTGDTITVRGFARGCPDENGELVFDGLLEADYSNPVLQDYHAEMEAIDPRQTPESFELHNPALGATEILSFTDALGSPRGEFGFENALGDRLGPFELDVARVDPDCEAAGGDGDGGGTDPSADAPQYSANIEGGPHAGSYGGLAIGDAADCEAGDELVAFTYAPTDADAEITAIIVSAEPGESESFNASVFFGDASSESDIVTVAPGDGMGSGTASAEVTDDGITIDVSGQTADGIGLEIEVSCPAF